jgi:hypothetical protein
MAKELSELEQILVDTIKGAGNLTSDIVEGTKVVGTKAIDFASEQIPEVIHQLLLWKFTTSLMAFCLGLSLFISTIIGVRLVSKQKHWHSSDRDFCIGLTILLGGVFSTIIMCANLTWLKIWIAPKLFLIEYAAELICKVS